MKMGLIRYCLKEKKGVDFRSLKMVNACYIVKIFQILVSQFSKLNPTAISS